MEELFAHLVVVLPEVTLPAGHHQSPHVYIVVDPAVLRSPDTHARPHCLDQIEEFRPLLLGQQGSEEEPVDVVVEVARGRVYLLRHNLSDDRLEFFAGQHLNNQNAFLVMLVKYDNETAPRKRDGQVN